MKFGIHTLDEIELHGKTVLCRIDIDTPIDRSTGQPIELDRLRACAPTILELSDEGAKVVLLARRSAEPEEPDQSSALYAQALSQILGRKVRFLNSLRGPIVRDAILTLQNGEILLLDNLCRLPKQTLAEESASLIHELASCADLFICDSFVDAHSQPCLSLCSLAQVLPSAMGRLMEEELTMLSHLRQTQLHPCLFLFGGAKLADTLQTMEAVLQQNIADQVMVAGIVGLTMLRAAGYHIGRPTQTLIEKYGADDLTDQATGLLERYHSRIILPIDYGYLVNGKRREAMLHALPEDALVTDIGSGTAELYYRLIMQAKTVFARGAMGIYQESECNFGTRRVWEALTSTSAYTVIGGINTVAALRRCRLAGSIDYISSGNTALLRLLTGRDLPALEALRNAVK